MSFNWFILEWKLNFSCVFLLETFVLFTFPLSTLLSSSSLSNSLLFFGKYTRTQHIKNFAFADVIILIHEMVCFSSVWIFLLCTRTKNIIFMLRHFSWTDFCCLNIKLFPNYGHIIKNITYFYSWFFIEWQNRTTLNYKINSFVVVVVV